MTMNKEVFKLDTISDNSFIDIVDYFNDKLKETRVKTHVDGKDDANWRFLFNVNDQDYMILMQHYGSAVYLEIYKGIDEMGEVVHASKVMDYDLADMLDKAIDITIKAVNNINEGNAGK